MADFPPNLDDGELWLPSDIIRDVGGVTRHSHRRHSPPSLPAGGLPVKAPSAGFAYIDDLACQLAAVGLLDHSKPPAVAVAVAPAVRASKPSPKQASDLQGPKGGRPALRLQPPPIVGAAYGGFWPPAWTMVAGVGDGGLGALPCGLAEPVHGRVLQRPPKPVRGRFIPVRIGLGRECGGTGVFIPRVSGAPISINNCSNSKKKPHGKGGERQQQQCTRNAGGELWKQQQGMPLQSSAETGLPQDWTY